MRDPWRAIPICLGSGVQSIPQKRVREMLATLQSVLARWFYRSALEITAGQEQRERGKRPDWAAPLNDLEGDDAFDTIIQVLCYRLLSAIG